MRWHIQVRGSVPRCEAASIFLDPEGVIMDAALDAKLYHHPVDHVLRRPYRCGYETLAEALEGVRWVRIGYPDACVVSGDCRTTS